MPEIGIAIINPKQTVPIKFVMVNPEKPPNTKWANRHNDNHISIGENIT
jgi:hypothetical protein